MSSAVFMAGSPSSSHLAASAPDSVVVALAVTLAMAAAWLFEFRRRQSVAASSEAMLLLRQLTPEICGFLLLFIVTGGLLLRGDNQGMQVQGEDEQIWQQIRNEWPYLTTADSLLAIQGMLRLLLLVSAAFRWKEMVSSPLAGWPLAFFLVSAMSTGSLLVLSPPEVYHLDGPLGGLVHMAVQAASAALLVYLAATDIAVRGRPRCKSAFQMALTLTLLAWMASRNFLALAEAGHLHLDVLFSFRELVELAAAVSYLACSFTAPSCQESLGALTVLAMALLPLQQLLSAYFLLTSWGGAPLEEIPVLVGAGQPLTMMQLAAVAQIGAYLAAGVTQVVLGKSADKEPAFYAEL